MTKPPAPWQSRPGRRESFPLEGDPIFAAALALWRHRELSFPEHTRRGKPDATDYATGAWARTVKEAEAAVDGYLSAMHSST